MTLPAGHLDMSLYELALNMPYQGQWSRASARDCLNTGILVWTHPDKVFQLCLTYNECHDCKEHHHYYSLLFSFRDGATYSTECDDWDNFSSLLTPFDFTYFLWLSYEDLHAQRLAVEKRYQTEEALVERDALIQKQVLSQFN